MTVNFSGKLPIGAALLCWTVVVSGCSSNPTSPSATSGVSTGQSAVTSTAAPSMAPMPTGQSGTAKFPPADVAGFRTIVTDTLAKVQAGDQAGAVARITDLESAWDQAQDRLQPLDPTGWESLDRKIDKALKAVRASAPDPAVEKQTLTELSTALQ